MTAEGREGGDLRGDSMALGHDKGALCGRAGLGWRRSAGTAGGPTGEREPAANEMCDFQSLPGFALMFRY